MIPLIITCGVLGGLFLLLFITLLLLYLFVYRSPYPHQLSDQNLRNSSNFKGYQERIKELIIKLMETPCEDIYISSFDKVKLHARFYAQKDSKKVAILCHGYRGTAYRDFCGGAYEIARMGYNLLLIDQRAHGLSKGHSITFGVKETKDLLCWIKYIKEKLGEDIELLLVGVSMGAFTVLNAVDKVSDDVKVVADSPYSSPKAIIVNSIKSVKLPVWLFYPLLKLSALLFMHVNIGKPSAYQTLSKRKNTILIVHGDNDKVVPYQDSQLLANSFPSVIQYHLFPTAGHGTSYIADTERYRKIIQDYLR